MMVHGRLPSVHSSVRLRELVRHASTALHALRQTQPDTLYEFEQALANMLALQPTEFLETYRELGYSALSAAILRWGPHLLGRL